MSISDDPELRSHAPNVTTDSRVFVGEIQLREEGIGAMHATSFRLEIAADWITLQYDDGKEHLGRLEESVVTFFRTKVAPSLQRPVAH